MNYRNLGFLVSAQLFFMIANMMFVTMAPILGKQLLDNPSYATLPMAMSMLAMLVFSMPISLWMGKKGRGPAFKLGLLSNMVAAVFFFMALQLHLFSLLLVGGIFFGFSIAAANFYRFAAMELVNEDKRAKAISAIMAVGVVAAMIGPNLGSFVKDMVFEVEFSSSVLSFIPLSIMALIMIFMIKWPSQKDQEIPTNENSKENSAHKKNKNNKINLWNTGLWKPILTAMTAYGVMVLVMSATPLHMHHHHYDFSDTAWVIQWHVLGMFAPSFFTGWLVKKMGLNGLIIAGVVILFGSVAVNLIADDRSLLTLGLILLGVGWNFLFIGSSQWLAQFTAKLNVKQRSKVQGINEVLVFGLASAATLSSGWIINVFGWQMLNIAALPILLLLLVVLISDYWGKKTAPTIQTNNL
jgi:MFS family permease